MIKRFVMRYKKWREWRKYTRLNKFRQLCVFLGVERCVHFEFFITDSLINRSNENEDQA